MKKVAVMFSFIFTFICLSASVDGFSGLQGGFIKGADLLKPDSQSYSFSSGIFSGGGAYQSYSLFSAKYSSALSKNITLTYDLSYLNANIKNSYLMGGIGLSYGNENFRFSLYMNRVFDSDDYGILR